MANHNPNNITREDVWRSEEEMGELGERWEVHQFGRILHPRKTRAEKIAEQEEQDRRAAEYEERVTDGANSEGPFIQDHWIKWFKNRYGVDTDAFWPRINGKLMRRYRGLSARIDAAEKAIRQQFINMAEKGRTCD